MHWLRTALLTSASLCSAAGLGAQASSDTSIGVWPWLVGDIDSYESEIIAKAQSTGLDTIYLSVWRTTGPRAGDLHLVDEARTWSTADGRLLPRVTASSFIRRAHAAGIQVVGVVKVFNDNVLPSDRAHQDHIVQKVIRYLVHSYDAAGRPVYPFDGIALDYIRWFGGSNAPAEVNRFLDATRVEVGPLPIHAYVVAGPYALDAASYDNSFRTYAGLRSYLSTNYGQDWEAMARRIDCLMPMTYIADGGVYGSNLAWMEGYTKAAAGYARIAVSAANPKCRVVLAIRTWNSTGETTTRATVEASCRGAIRGGANGFMAFRYFTARGHEEWFKGLQGYALPGQDMPIAEATVSSVGAEATVDTGGSFHSKVARTALQGYVDLDGDGAFEVGPLALGSVRRPLANFAPRVVHVRITDPGGQFAVARRRLEPRPVLASSHATVSTIVGGTVTLRLRPGAREALQHYVVFVSLSGTTPGTPLGPRLTVPLNVDPLTSLVYSGGNTALFQRFLGAFDASGSADAVLAVQGGIIPGQYIGSRLDFAAVGVDRATAAPRFASNAVALRITL